MPSIIETISADLSVPVQLVREALDLAHIRYRKISVPKRTGGYRTIIQPSAELKLVQRWLSSIIFEKLPVSSVATAFLPGASIVKNAAVHRHSKYSVRVDLSEFFPSIRSIDLIRVISSAKVDLPSWVSTPEFEVILRKACFDRTDALPIGYPSSPILANAVMINVDGDLQALINSNPEKFGRACLTRYADDFVFSTDKAGACKSFVDEMRKLLMKTNSPRLKINDAKTRFMSRPGGSTLVTGLRINQFGGVRVHPDYRDHVRLLLKHFANGTLKKDEHRVLVGHLAHVEHADPQLFTRLSYKYFAEIARIRGG